MPAVKSLLVRARTGLAEASEARDTDCALIREQLALAVDRPGRPPRLLRDHLRECSPCRAHRQALRHGHAQLASLLPGPSTLLLGGWLASLLGSGGASGAAVGSSIAAGAGKALAVASASVAVAGGAAEVADHAHPPAKRHHAAAVTATPAPRAPGIRIATAAARPPVTPPAPAPAPHAEQLIDATPSPGPVAAGPALDKDDEPAATPEPTATPTHTPTPTQTPTHTPTPDPTTTPEPVPTAETAAEPTATPPTAP